VTVTRQALRAEGAATGVQSRQKLEHAAGGLVGGEHDAHGASEETASGSRLDFRQHLVVRGKRAQPLHEGKPAHAVLGLGREAHAVAVLRQHVERTLSPAAASAARPSAVSASRVMARCEVALSARTSAVAAAAFPSGRKVPPGEAQLGARVGVGQRGGQQKRVTAARRMAGI
jgi:hypothetical protein